MVLSSHAHIINFSIAGASTEFLWHPNPDERPPSHGRNSDSLSDYYSYDDDDDDEWSVTQAYECVEVSPDSRKYISHDPYSTTGDKNTYESVCNVTNSAFSEKSIVESKRHINDKAGEDHSIEMTELQHPTNKDQVTAPDSGSHNVDQVYAKTERNYSQANDLTVTKDEASNLYEETKEADYIDNGSNIYDTAEGLEGQQIERPEGNRLSQDFSRLSVLSSVFDTSEEKHVYDFCDDEGDYDAPEDIIVA